MRQLESRRAIKQRPVNVLTPSRVALHEAAIRPRCHPHLFIRELVPDRAAHGHHGELVRGWLVRGWPVRGWLGRGWVRGGWLRGGWLRGGLRIGWLEAEVPLLHQVAHTGTVIALRSACVPIAIAIAPAIAATLALPPSVALPPTAAPPIIATPLIAPLIAPPPIAPHAG